MIQAAENKVVVKVATKYISNITSIAKIAAIQNNSSIHIEDVVNIQGEIVSLPISISKDRSHEGFSLKDLRVGDRTIFSFSVIAEYYQKEYNGEPVYKNLITYKAEEYWLADITKIFAVIRNGKIIMVNGYVMATPFLEDKIVLQTSSKKAKGVKSSEIMNIGNPKEGLKKITAKQGDTIYFSPSLPQKYQINNKHFIILQQHQVLGKLKNIK